MVTALYPLRAFTIYNPQAHFNLSTCGTKIAPAHGEQFGDDAVVRRWSVAGLIRLTGADTGGDARLSVVHLAEDQFLIPKSVGITSRPSESDTADPNLVVEKVTIINVSAVGLSAF